MSLTLNDHLFAPGPKRILSLDGGGVRGALTLEYLARIETMLRTRTGNGELVLADYFDLIGGTSTGSIIAVGLALGFPVAKLQALYRDLAGSVFEKPPLRQGLFVSKFPTGPLDAALETHFKDETLGSDKLLTGLMVMTKRLDTGSPWPLHNNPKGKYYNDRPQRVGGLGNKHFLLRSIVRASTAAPSYFEPERLHVSTDETGNYVDGAFVDGGVSPSNNPALQLLMLAGLSGYGFNWPLGAENILLVSIGTGSEELRLKPDDVMKMPAGLVAMRALVALMNDCDAMLRTMLQWMSRSATPWVIDRELRDLRDDVIGGRELITYLRYNVMLDAAWLKQSLDLDWDPTIVSGLRAMDDARNLAELVRLGAAAAEKQVKDEHFPARFDTGASPRAADR